MRWVAILLALLWLEGWPAPAIAADTLRGVALVIGNGAYEHLTPLANPETDARAIEDMLDDLGFETFDARDADAKKLRRAIERFVEDAEGADVAVVYYAGHGIEARGENFLVPVDADISALDAAGERLVPLSALMAKLRAAVPVTIILLDACRDNPFPPGSTVRLSADAAPAAVGAGGLGETRGVTPLGRAT
ncbi:MAG: caspase family protein, partial [Mesorhizobium sp.]|nr:caspase family protein [Mesorhizobium sp.]